MKFELNNYKAVVFDLDGTLLNSLEDIADSVNAMLSECDYPTYSYEQYRFLVGNGFCELVNRCLPEGQRGTENFARCCAIAMGVYERQCINKSSLYEGIPQLLDHLTERGVMLAILSNKPDELTQIVVNALFAKWKFEVVLGANERFPRKPDTASSLYIAKTLELLPSEIIFVGDSDVDMKTANRAGLYAVGVSWGFRPRAELEENGAQLIIDHPSELE